MIDNLRKVKNNILASFTGALLRLKGANIGSSSIIMKGNVVLPKNLKVGSYCYIGPFFNIYSRGSVEIGDGSIVGPRLIIHSGNHDYNNNELAPYGDSYIIKGVKIGKAVWIGDSVIILPGTTIPDGCIIAAGSVLRGELEAYSIYAGNPAVKVGDRKNQDVFKNLIDSNKYYLASK